MTTIREGWSHFWAVLRGPRRPSLGFLLGIFVFSLMGALFGELLRAIWRTAVR